MLDHCADQILGGLSVIRVLDLIHTCGSRSFAEKAFQRIRLGDVRFPPFAKHRLYMEDMALRLKSAVDLHGLSLDPARVLAEGKARSRRSGSYPASLEAGIPPLVEDVVEAGDDTLIEPAAPCPCGSGKKYGNCCGRVV